MLSNARERSEYSNCSSCGCKADFGFLLPAWLYRSAQDEWFSQRPVLFPRQVSIDSDSHFRKPAGLGREDVSSINRCFNMLKRRCLGGVPPDFVPENFTIANVKKGWNPPSKTGSKSVPTFENLLGNDSVVEIDRTSNRKLVQNRKWDNQKEQAESIPVLAEIHYLPPFSKAPAESKAKKSKAASKKQPPISYEESVCPSPNLCLELVQQRLRNGYYRQKNGLIDDLQEAYVTSVLLVLSKQTSHKFGPNLSIKKLARFLNKNVTTKNPFSKKGKKKSECDDAAKKGPEQSKEQEIWTDKIQQVRSLYAMALVSVSETPYVESIFGTTSKKGAAARAPGEPSEQQQRFKATRQKLDLLLAALSRDPCLNRDKALRGATVFGSQEGNVFPSISLKIVSSSSLTVDKGELQPIVFSPQEYANQEDLVRYFFGKPGRMEACGRCQVYRRSMLVCRVQRGHSNQDFSWEHIMSGTGGADGLLYSLRTGNPPIPLPSDAIRVGNSRPIEISREAANKEEPIEPTQTTAASTQEDNEKGKEELEQLEKAGQALALAQKLLVDAKKESELPVRLADKFIRTTFPIDPADGHYNYCIICGLSGDVICCENCPIVMHPGCAGSENVPEGDWFCLKCTTADNAKPKEDGTMEAQKSETTAGAATGTSSVEAKEQENPKRLTAVNAKLKEGETTEATVAAGTSPEEAEESTDQENPKCHAADNARLKKDGTIEAQKSESITGAAMGTSPAKAKESKEQENPKHLTTDNAKLKEDETIETLKNETTTRAAGTSPAEAKESKEQENPKRLTVDNAKLKEDETIEALKNETTTGAAAAGRSPAEAEESTDQANPKRLAADNAKPKEVATNETTTGAAVGTCPEETKEPKDHENPKESIDVGGSNLPTGEAMRKQLEDLLHDLRNYRHSHNPPRYKKKEDREDIGPSGFSEERIVTKKNAIENAELESAEEGSSPRRSRRKPEFLIEETGEEGDKQHQAGEATKPIGVGSKVSKAFGATGQYMGMVKALPTDNYPFFNVRYEDGDEEDMDETELRRVLIFIKSPRKRKQSVEAEETPRKRGRPRKSLGDTERPGRTGRSRRSGVSVLETLSPDRVEYRPGTRVVPKKNKWQDKPGTIVRSVERHTWEVKFDDGKNRGTFKSQQLAFLDNGYESGEDDDGDVDDNEDDHDGYQQPSRATVGQQVFKKGVRVLPKKLVWQDKLGTIIGAVAKFTWKVKFDDGVDRGTFKSQQLIFAEKEPEAEVENVDEGGGDDDQQKSEVRVEFKPGARVVPKSKVYQNEPGTIVRSVGRHKWELKFDDGVDRGTFKSQQLVFADASSDVQDDVQDDSDREGGATRKEFREGVRVVPKKNVYRNKPGMIVRSVGRHTWAVKFDDGEDRGTFKSQQLAFATEQPEIQEEADIIGGGGMDDDVEVEAGRYEEEEPQESPRSRRGRSRTDPVPATTESPRSRRGRSRTHTAATRTESPTRRGRSRTNLVAARTDSPTRKGRSRSRNVPEQAGSVVETRTSRKRGRPSQSPKTKADSAEPNDDEEDTAATPRQSKRQRKRRTFS